MMPLKPEKHNNPFSFFLATNKKEIKWILFNSVFYGMGTVCGIGTSFYLGKVIDALNTNNENIQKFIIILVLVLFGNEIFYRIGHIFEVTVSARIRKKTKETLFNYTTKLSFGYFIDRFAGQISHQISTTADKLEDMKNVVTNNFIDHSWMIVVSLIALASVYPLLSLVVIIWTILFLFGLRFFTKKITSSSEIFANNQSNTTGALVDIYTNISTVKVYGRDFDKNKINNQINKEYKSQLLVGKWEVFTYGYQGLSATILACILLIVTAYGYIHGIITVGQIVIIAGIGLKILENVYDTGHSISNFIRDYGECSQALKDLIVIPSIIDGDNQINNEWKSVSVDYKNIGFSYGQNKEVLNNFTLNVPAGQKVGIVGLSGAGKTTIINLLLRFFDPQTGSIEINGIDISNISQDFLRSHISFISQDTSLFHASIAENIQYGSLPASKEKIQEVARMAYAEDFISKLPNEYDTIVGERGVKLSGGQRQRIAIARAILKNSPLFILDEATSALDSDSELKVQEALKILMQKKTVIAIAHRLSTLQFMDRIVFVENGQIIEDGTHEELLIKNGKYAKLWHMQAGGFLLTDISDQSI